MPEKKKHQKKSDTVQFPLTTRINDYGFLGFRAPWLAALSWQKGMAVKIQRNDDGSITVRKA